MILINNIRISSYRSSLIISSDPNFLLHNLRTLFCGLHCALYRTSTPSGTIPPSSPFHVAPGKVIQINPSSIPLWRYLIIFYWVILLFLFLGNEQHICWFCVIHRKGSIPSFPASEGTVRISYVQAMNNWNTWGHRVLKGRKTNPSVDSSDGQHICLSKPMYSPARKVPLSQLHAVWDSTITTLMRCIQSTLWDSVLILIHVSKTLGRSFYLCLRGHHQSNVWISSCLWTQLGFPGSFLTWKGWYKDKLLDHHPYNSALNPVLCCLPSDASPFVLTSAVSARSLTLTEHLPHSLLPSF